MRHALWSRFVVPFLLLLAPAACDQTPPDLREWKPTDHDHTTNPGQDQVQGGADAGIEPELAAHGLTDVAMVAWQQDCVTCHGPFGRGNGPQGALVHAPDLSDPHWQASVTDDDIAKIIHAGRGLMPAFPMPDTTLKTLVHLVRLLTQVAQPGASASAAPGASAPVLGANPHAVRAGAAPSAHASPAKSAHVAAPANAAPATATAATSSR